MFSLFTKFTGCALFAAIVALACVPAVASAGRVDAVPSQDLRSPDTRDGAHRNQSPTSSLAGTTSQDRRLPDPDVALAQERYYSSYENAAPTPTVVSLRAPSDTGSGFDWFAAAVGACAAGLSLLTTAGVLLLRRRTRHQQAVAIS
jgi:hypothetical protein